MRDFYRGDEIPDEPMTRDELEKHRHRVQEWMKPKRATRATPLINGEIMCILAKPKLADALK